MAKKAPVPARTNNQRFREESDSIKKQDYVILFMDFRANTV